METTKEKIERSKKVYLIPTMDPDKFIANKKYDVEVQSDSEYSCTCPDFRYHDRLPCKHIIAAALEKKMKVEEERDPGDKWRDGSWMDFIKD